MGIREIGEMREIGKMGEIAQNSTLPIPYSLFPIP